MAVAYIPAKWQKPGRSKKIRLVVIHCTVSPEMGDGAEAVANWFANPTRAGSTHLVSDNNSTVRCVLDENTAAGAVGANNDGLHLELVGMPDQTAEEWTDAYSLAELAEAGPHLREWSQKWGVPPRWLSVAEILAGDSGFCTHADIEAAYPSTGHWDPGPNFPKQLAMDIWFPSPVLPSEETEMVIIEATSTPTKNRGPRLLAPPAFSRVTAEDLLAYASVGVKAIRVSDDHYDATLSQIVKALD